MQNIHNGMVTNFTFIISWTKHVNYLEPGHIILSRVRHWDTWGGCLRSKAQVLTEVLQLFLAGRCRLEVTSGTIRARCLPRVYQWNIHPDTSASSWRNLFLPPRFWEVWKGDTPMLTLLCPTCHLTFMLDVSSPATAVQSPPTLMPNMMHCLNLRLRTLAREKKQSRSGQRVVSVPLKSVESCNLRILSNVQVTQL